MGLSRESTHALKKARSQLWWAKAITEQNWQRVYGVRPSTVESFIIDLDYEWPEGGAHVPLNEIAAAVGKDRPTTRRYLQKMELMGGAISYRVISYRQPNINFSWLGPVNQTREPSRVKIDLIPSLIRKALKR